ncbi:bromodomain-containing factor 1, partial [Lecanoromycetidae sp. Uapishka_2]
MTVDSSSFDLPPAVAHEPTSGVREKIHLVAVEQTVEEIKGQEQQDDLMRDPNPGGAIEIGALEPVTSALEPEAQLESAMPPTSAQEAQVGSAEPSAPVDAQASHPSNTTEPTSPEKPINVLNIANPNHQPVEVGEAPIDPAPSPAAPAEVPASDTKAPESLREDEVMQDAPHTSAKVAREREDDDLADGPAAKRSKTDEEAPSASDFKVPERPTINTQVDGVRSEEAAKPAPPMTVPQHKAAVRIMTNIKRIQASANFRLPVDYVTLKIPSYPEVIKTPMDLRTLEENLRTGYAKGTFTVDDFVAGFNLIVDNCRTFNGPDHTITGLANQMKANFDHQMKNMPGPDVAVPSPVDKKKKSTVPPASKLSQPRRESRQSLPGSAGSPVSASSPQTFALGPQGVPLIRRDSTLGDGRPKREIHPPAPRDLPYTNQKPKKKKFLWELKFCDHVLKELEKPKYLAISHPFMVPVDPVALNIPTYHSIIKKPMDFGTVRQKLDRGEYENAKEFESDVRLIFQNCYKFNKTGDAVNVMGHQFEEQFELEWAKKSSWIEANTPASGAQTSGSSDVEDSDEEEQEEEEDEEDELSVLQRQIAEINNRVQAITQKKKSPPVSNKKAAKAAKPVRRDSKKSSAPIKSEKKASAKPAKKEKVPYISYEQKQDISTRINSLNEKQMATALKIIRDNMPTLKGIQDDELELDIDELSDDVLFKLYTYVKKSAPLPDDDPVRPAPATSSAAPTRKKNKPMSKHEQEARIAQVQNGLSAFQNPGSVPSYDDPLPGNESSDGAETSESEEE